MTQTDGLVVFPETAEILLPEQHSHCTTEEA